MGTRPEHPTCPLWPAAGSAGGARRRDNGTLWLLHLCSPRPGSRDVTSSGPGPVGRGPPGSTQPPPAAEPRLGGPAVGGQPPVCGQGKRGPEARSESHRASGVAQAAPAPPGGCGCELPRPWWAGFGVGGAGAVRGELSRGAACGPARGALGQGPTEALQVAGRPCSASRILVQASGPSACSVLGTKSRALIVLGRGQLPAELAVCRQAAAKGAQGAGLGAEVHLPSELGPTGWPWASIGPALRPPRALP